jgi:hypothetical protein
MKIPITSKELKAKLLEELRCLDGAEDATDLAFYVVRDESVDFDFMIASTTGLISEAASLHFLHVVVPVYQLRFTLAPDDSP